MSRKLHRALVQYIDFLKQHYADRIATAFLFGSVARGETSKESDADILIIISDGNSGIKDEISMAAYDIMLKHDVVLSPLVMDRETFDWYKKYKDPFYSNIRRHGIEIWKKPPENFLRSA